MSYKETTTQNKTQNENYTVISDIDRLMVASAAREHTVRVDADDENAVMKVWVKDLTFLQMQEAVKSFVAIGGDGGIDLDLAGYWKYMIEKCVERTEPKLSKIQMLGLNAYAGQQLTALLPQPQDLVAAPL